MSNKRYSLLVTDLTKDKVLTLHRDLNTETAESIIFSGVGYFDNHLSEEVNGIIHKIDVSVANVNFSKKDNLNKSDEYIGIKKGDLWDVLTTQSVTINLDSEIYEKLLKSNQANIEIDLVIKEFYVEDDELQQVFFEITKIETSSTPYIKKNLKQERVEDVKSYLIRTNCADAHGGQLVNICREFAESLGDINNDYECNAFLRDINELIGLIRYTFQNEVDSDNEEFAKYIATLGGREKRDALVKHNDFYKTKSHYEILKSGIEFTENDVNGIVYDYFKLDKKSETFEKILLEMLLAVQIAEAASYYQINNLLSTDAILNASSGIYKEKVKSQTAKLVGSLIGWLVGIAISWVMSGLIAGNNDTAHIILFGIFYAISSLYTYAYQNKENQKESNSEKKYFYLLSRICHIYSQRNTKDKNLLKTLVYKLEEDGIAFNLAIHKLLM